MASGGDISRNGRKLQAHRCRVAPRQDQSDSLAFLRADGAEDVGRGGALVVRSGRPGSPQCPSASDLVLLADPRLVAKPDLYVAGIDTAFARNRRQHRRPSFFKSLDCALGLGMVPRARRELAITHRSQLAAE